MTLPELLERYDDTTVLEALVCFERTEQLEFVGREAELAEELIRGGFVRATVSARFILSDGEVRLRLLSHGLSVAGAWMKRLIESGAGRVT